MPVRSSFTAGEVLTAADLTDTFASKLDDSDATWITWTPTYTNLTVGNGTVISKYVLLNKVCLFRYYLKFGSTTSLSTTPKITLPFAINQTADFTIAGFPLVMHDAGTAIFTGIATVGWSATANDSVELAFSTVSGSNVGLASLTATGPFTWAVNDKISFSGMYEVA